MARDLATAHIIVQTVMDSLMAGPLGCATIEWDPFVESMEQAVEAVADLLDPDEEMDAEIADEEMAEP